MGWIILQKDENLSFKLRKVKDRLERAGVRWGVFAGAGAHCYGSKRKVTDIDILVRAMDLEKAKAALKDVEGFDVVADMEIKTKEGICCFFMDNEMIERTQWKQLFNVTVPIIPVEDNIIFKAILQRGENQGKHDIEDIKRMTTKEKLDSEYLERRIKKYNAEKRVKPLLKLLGIL